VLAQLRPFRGVSEAEAAADAGLRESGTYLDHRTDAPTTGVSHAFGV
jgi:hypothetical protein